jgi:predicted homoserine dehydrogenase-like protein
MTQFQEKFTRRDFMKIGTAGLGAAAMGAAFEADAKAANNTGSLIGFKAAPIEVVRVGFVGVGGMGSAHVKNLLNIEGVELRAVCDLVEERVARVQEWVTKAGGKKPEGYSKGEQDFRRMCDRQDIDLVYVVTPWEWHVPIALAAMSSGKHVA